ncbi:hypothetical protein TNCV_2477261 [Trichonephila clavipes]|nr:hypothetical protein TNCV_2477261 [Trichonephila clavipes]
MSVSPARRAGDRGRGSATEGQHRSRSRSPAANVNCSRSRSAARVSRPRSLAANVNISISLAVNINISRSPVAAQQRLRCPSSSFNSSRGCSTISGPSNRQPNRRRQNRKRKVQRSPYLNWGNSRRELVYDYPPHRLTFHNDDRDFTVHRIPNKLFSLVIY